MWSYSSHLLLLLGSLLLGLLTALADPGQDVLSVFVELQLGYDNFAWVDADWDRLAVRLFSGDSLDMDEVLQSVDRGDLAFTAFLGPSNNGDFVVLSNWDTSDLATISYCNRLCLYVVRTPCFSLSSFERGALMIPRRSEEGAPKWALRDLRLEDATPAWIHQIAIIVVVQDAPTTCNLGHVLDCWEISR